MLRLREMIEGTHVRGHEDERMAFSEGGIGADLLDELDAVENWHQNVEEHDRVIRRGAQHVERILPVGRFGHRVS